MQWLLQKIVGTKNQRDIRKLQPLVDRINALEQEYQSLTDEQLKAKTREFRERLADGETLDGVLCEAFAAVKNACRRLCGSKVNVCGHEVVWDMVPFDVQLMGGMTLHQGRISEMATGEGKTLVATMPLYLNALLGRNVHLVTVNDYLARRDSQWMGAVYTYLGLTVGCIQNYMGPEERRAEYSKDITYGTNSEFGFDYLRDNGMAWRPEDQVQLGVEKERFLTRLDAAWGDGAGAAGAWREFAGRGALRQGVDVVAAAAEGRLEPALDRLDETGKLLAALAGKRGRIPILLAERGGSGVAGVIEGLARRIARGKVPEALNGARVLVPAVSGRADRARRLAALRDLLGETRRERGADVVFVDNVCDLLQERRGAQAQVEGATLESLRREGNWLCVGAGTQEQYDRLVRADHSLKSVLLPIVLGRKRGHYYAIIDEVDSILIDEARTPLIISGVATVSKHEAYSQQKPPVERLWRRQKELCDRLMQQAEDLIAKEQIEEAKHCLYKVHHGMPKHKGLMRLLEDPAKRRMLEQVEDHMILAEKRGEPEWYQLREELYFTIEEKGHQTSLTERGRRLLNPKNRNAYVLRDMTRMFTVRDARSAKLDALERVYEEERETLAPAEREAREKDIAKNRQRLEATNRRLEAANSQGETIQIIDQLIRAYALYEKDVEYVVKDGQVLIVDEFTGRILPGRRWSDGLHQAIEAKEEVKIERETQTLATITIQNYFRLYEKLAGMTGTAETEADEFHQIYRLEVSVIPTNRPVRRVDCNDHVYKTQREKINAILDEIVECHKRGQPVLVGTVSVESSERLSKELSKVGITHNVLNAKNHEREAEIVARAGQAGAVTIATNMAGRGTDIKLGEGVVWVDRAQIQSQTRLDDRADGGTLREKLLEKPCGLHVIGSERHESRRIDRQLRGRCARQGDPGSSRFYVSLEDDLMRLFGSDRIAGIMERLGLEEGQVLEHPWLNRSIETAQRRVEQQNFSIRKRTLEYDDVMNKQRAIIYAFRGEAVRTRNIREALYDILYDLIAGRVEEQLANPKEDSEAAFLNWMRTTFFVGVRREDVDPKAHETEEIIQALFEKVAKAYEAKVAAEPRDMVALIERHVVLSGIDSHWQDYLRSMDNLRQGVGLRAYGQRDPLIEYKREAFTMFGTLMDDIREDVASRIFRPSATGGSLQRLLTVLPRVQAPALETGPGRAAPTPVAPAKPAPRVAGGEEVLAAALRTASAPVRQAATAKVGRNDPCPCGSGKKYKKCCGAA